MRKVRKMLLEEFENVPAVIRQLISIRGELLGEICDTIILSFNGEIVERRVKQFEKMFYMKVAI